jgi:hypothetical protein
VRRWVNRAFAAAKVGIERDDLLDRFGVGIEFDGVQERRVGLCSFALEREGPAQVGPHGLIVRHQQVSFPEQPLCSFRRLFCSQKARRQIRQTVEAIGICAERPLEDRLSLSEFSLSHQGYAECDLWLRPPRQQARRPAQKGDSLILEAEPAQAKAFDVIHVGVPWVQAQQFLQNLGAPLNFSGFHKVESLDVHLVAHL